MKSLSAVFKGLLGEIDRFGGRQGLKAYAQGHEADDNRVNREVLRYVVLGREKMG